MDARPAGEAECALATTCLPEEINSANLDQVPQRGLDPGMDKACLVLLNNSHSAQGDRITFCSP